MSGIERVMRAYTTEGMRQVVWSWDPGCPVAVTVRVGDREALLARDLLEDLLTQVNVADRGMAPAQVDVRPGVSLIAVPALNGLHLARVAPLPLWVVTDLAAVDELLSESFAACPPCPDPVWCGSGFCEQHSALASWADEALDRLIAGSAS